MRLIDADALKKHLRELDWITDDPFAESGSLEEVIDDEPTIKTFTLADIEAQYRKGLEKGLEERPHGEWKEIWHTCVNARLTCSVCEKAYLFYEKANFCPNCGARMKEGEEK